MFLHYLIKENCSLLRFSLQLIVIITRLLLVIKPCHKMALKIYSYGLEIQGRYESNTYSANYWAPITLVVFRPCHCNYLSFSKYSYSYVLYGLNRHSSSSKLTKLSYQDTDIAKRISKFKWQWAYVQPGKSTAVGAEMSMRTMHASESKS